MLEEQVKYLAFEDELEKIALTISGEEVASKVRKHAPAVASKAYKALMWGPKLRVGKTILEFPIGASILLSAIVNSLRSSRRNAKLKERQEEIREERYRLTNHATGNYYRGFRNVRRIY